MVAFQAWGHILHRLQDSQLIHPQNHEDSQRNQPSYLKIFYWFYWYKKKVLNHYQYLPVGPFQCHVHPTNLKSLPKMHAASQSYISWKYMSYEYKYITHVFELVHVQAVLHRLARNFGSQQRYTKTIILQLHWCLISVVDWLPVFFRVP